jgi:DHA1 family bicyclomycin/chloramphenicol resistance-like MFS transporter
MARYFDTDYAIVQLAVSLYLAAVAVLQLGIGPASDRFGRRPVMLFCFAMFIVATGAAIVAPSIEALLVCRVLQAFSAAGMVLSRAIVRDTVGADLAASRIGYITMGMTLAPMLAPIAGGFLDEIYGWQSTFLLTLVFGIISFTIVYLDLGETITRRSSSIGAQFAAYPELITSRRFWGYTLTAAFTSGAFFAFLGGAPYVATEMLGLTPSQYGIYFGLISIGYMVGNFISGRFSARIGINRMLLMGNVLAALGMALAIVLFRLGYNHPMVLFGCTCFTGLGNGITLPNANAGIVSVRPRLAGSASGLGGSLQIGGGAALSVLAGALLTPHSGPYPLLWVMVISSLLAVFSTLYIMHVARTAGDL